VEVSAVAQERPCRRVSTDFVRAAGRQGEDAEDGLRDRDLEDVIRDGERGDRRPVTVFRMSTEWDVGKLLVPRTRGTSASRRPRAANMARAGAPGTVTGPIGVSRRTLPPVWISSQTPPEQVVPAATSRTP